MVKAHQFVQATFGVAHGLNIKSLFIQKRYQDNSFTGSSWKPAAYCENLPHAVERKERRKRERGSRKGWSRGRVVDEEREKEGNKYREEKKELGRNSESDS